MKQALQLALAIALGASAAILITGAGLWVLLRALVGSMNAEAVTTVLWLVLTLPLVCVAGVYLFVRALWAAKHNAGRNDQVTQPDTWDVRTIEPRPPVQIDRPPIRVNVPLYRNMGKPEPLGARRVEVSSTQDGEEITVPMAQLYKFASLPTPSRSEWTGKTDGYTQASKFFLAHGFTTAQKKGGYLWRADYDQSSRRGWLEQFENEAVGTGDQ